LALLLGYWALLRVGETEALYWEDITVVGSRLDIHVRKSKNDQLALGHDIKLDHLSVPRPIRDLFLACKGNKGRIFELTTQTDWNAIITKQFHAPEIVFHSLRHGRASALWRAGHSIEDIMERGRWRTKQACFGYLH
jgi:integrase